MKYTRDAHTGALCAVGSRAIVYKSLIDLLLLKRVDESKVRKARFLFIFGK